MFGIKTEILRCTLLGNKKLDEINKALIDKIKQHKKSTGVSTGTVNRTLTVLRAVLNAAKNDWDFMDNIPVIKLLPDNAIRVRWISQEQAAQLIRHNL